MMDQLVTIDPYGAEVDRLGPANAEQRAERKATRRKWWRRVLHVLHYVGVALAFVLVAVVFAVAGAYYGASDPDAVKDLMPSMPAPSGERADPEGGQ